MLCGSAVQCCGEPADSWLRSPIGAVAVHCVLRPGSWLPRRRAWQHHNAVGRYCGSVRAVQQPRRWCMYDQPSLARVAVTNDAPHLTLLVRALSSLLQATGTSSSLTHQPSPVASQPRRLMECVRCAIARMTTLRTCARHISVGTCCPRHCALRSTPRAHSSTRRAPAARRMVVRATPGVLLECRAVLHARW